MKKIFGSNKSEFYPVFENLALESAFEFSIPDNTVKKKLRELLVDLSEKEEKFKIERPLKSKQFTIHSKIDELVDNVMKNLETNYKDFSLEFASEQDLDFIYYLGTEMLFSNSVEVIQKVFYKNRTDIGNLYYFLTIKSNKGEYYYWAI